MSAWWTQHPLWHRTYIHWRVGRRLFSWPLGLTLLYLLLSLLTLDEAPAFGKSVLEYGMFFVPLMTMWVVPRLIPVWSESGWQIASKLSRWRLVLEHSLLGLVFFSVLWTLFLCLAWVVYGVSSDQYGSPEVPVTFSFVWWLWLNGLVNLFLFTGCAVVGRTWWNGEAAGFLAAGLWIGSLVLARVDGWFQEFLPFDAYFRIARQEIDLQTPEFGLQVGLLCLVSLGMWSVGIWSASTHWGPPRMRKVLKYQPDAQSTLFSITLNWGLHGPFWLRMAWLELRWALRRRALWGYLVIPTGLLLIVASFYRGAVITDYIPLMMSNALFFAPPLLAVLVAPVHARNASSDRDWFWSTPAVWTQTALAQLMVYGVLALGTTLIWGSALLGWGIVQEYWSWPQAHALLWPLGCLWLPMVLAQVCLISGLSLLLRRALAVIALACAITVGLWIGTDLLTLVIPHDIALVSLHFNPITGPGPEQVLAGSLVLFYLAMGLGLWLVALAVFPVWERRVTWTRRMQWATGCIACAGLGLGFLAGVNYGQQARGLRVPVTATAYNYAWTVLEVNHRARIDDGTVTVESRLAMSPPLEGAGYELELQLNPGLYLREVVWEDRSLTWTRTGEVVQVALPVGAEQSLTVEPLVLVLRYAGWPILLREDYSLPITGGVLVSRPINLYPRASISYADAPFLQWFRDSDWTVWPLTGGPHLAIHANTWSIDLSQTAYPVIAAPGGVMRTVGDRVHYSWREAPPSVLLLAGPYDPPTVGEPSVWLGPWQRPSDRERVGPIIELYRRLSAWSGDEAPAQVAYFPYGQLLHFADSWVMVPAMPSDYQLQADYARLDLAVRVAEDWLREQVAWQSTTYSGQGLHAQYAISCDWPENGRQYCSLIRDKYHRNPQAPHGRILDVDHCLYPSTKKCGSVSLLRRAWAITLAYYIAAEPAWFQDEWAEWHRIAEIPDQSGSGHNLAGEPNSFHNVCRLSSYVLTIHELVERHGEDFLFDWFQLMKKRHPPGAGTAVDDTIWQLAAELTGEAWIELHPTVCTEIMLNTEQ